MQLYLREDTSPVNNLLRDESTVKQREPGFHSFFFFFRVKNSVVMLPDCKSEYNNASALPGERNITLFTALLRPKKQLEKQPVSPADGIWRRSDCNARRNYQCRATRRGSVALEQTALHSLLTAAWTAQHHTSDVEVDKNNELQLAS